MEKKQLKNNLFPSLFLAVFFLWFLISFFRLIYNVIRIDAEEKNWLHYTDAQKRQVLYEDIYDVIGYLNSHYLTKRSLLIVSSDGKPYFVARYFLYPQLVYWDKLESHLLNDQKKYSIVVNFHPQDNKAIYSSSFFQQLTKNAKGLAIKKNNVVIALIYL